MFIFLYNSSSAKLKLMKELNWKVVAIITLLQQFFILTYSFSFSFPGKGCSTDNQGKHQNYSLIH